jgi:hypothetical protein
MSLGVIYIATGEKYIKEAIESAASLKEHIPKMPITLFSSSDEVNNSLFERVEIIENPKYEWSDKIKYIAKTPYQKTLFLDADTFVCSDFSEIFSLLLKFDIATAHAPTRTVYELENVPESFPEMNTGVILFNDSPHVKMFFDLWLTLYHKSMKKHPEPPHDQPAFREALYKSQLRIATLTPEYNCRFIMPGFVDKKVKILHGRHSNLPEVAKKINSNLKKRIFLLNKENQKLDVWS